MDQGARRQFLLAIGSLLAAPHLAAQLATRVPRIGFITGAEGQTEGTAAFVRGLEAHGHIIGKTVRIEWRYAAGKTERFPEFVNELVNLPVDVILASGPQAIVLARKASRTIPIVMAAAPDPVRLGVVASLAHPGGNVTGMTVEPSSEIFGKQLQVLKETIPKLAHFAVMLNPEMQGVQPLLDSIDRSAKILKMRSQKLYVRNEADLDLAFQSTAKERVEAILVIPDPANFGFRQKLADMELKYRMPGMHLFVEYAAAGGLMTYGPTLIEQFERGAAFVDRILKGASPADLPVEQPTKFELVINMKTARSLGLSIPSAILVRANRVIE